ncbi:MAG: 50S ribosomal protein L24 [Thermodesulfobacteriota bacterium]
MAQGSNYLKVNDQVEVIAGRDKGSVGKVVKVHRERQRVTVEKVNMVKRHLRPNPQNQQGGIISREAPIHVSNLMIVCPKCTKTVRIGHQLLDDGSKVRVCRKCGESVERKA